MSDDNVYWGTLFPMPWNKDYIPTNTLSYRRTSAWDKMLREGIVLVNVFGVRHDDNGVWPLSQVRDRWGEWRVAGVFLPNGHLLTRHQMQRRLTRRGYRVVRVQIVKVSGSKGTGSP